MKKILVINSKGGSGKTTISTNLASYYALWDVPVALVDYDPQRSSLDWLAQRDKHLPTIYAVDGSKGRVNVPAQMKRVIMDAPARTSGKQLAKLYEFADVVLIPVLPSPIDIRAAGHFIGELMLEGHLKSAPTALLANRTKANTTVFQNLQAFMQQLNLPILSYLRDSQNYIRAAESGIGIFEMPPYKADVDVENWRDVINWLEKQL